MRAYVGDTCPALNSTPNKAYTLITLLPSRPLCAKGLPKKFGDFSLRYDVYSLFISTFLFCRLPTVKERKRYVRGVVLVAFLVTVAVGNSW